MATDGKSPAYKAWTVHMSFALDAGFRRRAELTQNEFKKQYGNKYWMSFTCSSVGLFHWFVYSVKCALHGAKPYGIHTDYSCSIDGDSIYTFFDYDDCLRNSKGIGWKLEGVYCILSLLFSAMLIYARFMYKLRATQSRVSFFTYAAEAKVAKTLDRLDGSLKFFLILLLVVTFVSILFGRRFLSYLVNIVVPVFLFTDTKQLYRQFTNQFSFLVTAKKTLYTIIVLSLLAWVLYSVIRGNWHVFIILIIGAVLLSNVKFFAYIGLIINYFAAKVDGGFGLAVNKKATKSDSDQKVSPATRETGHPVAKNVAGAIGAAFYGDVSDNSMYSNNNDKIRKLEAEIKNLELEILKCEKKKKDEIAGAHRFQAREWGIRNELQKQDEYIKIYKKQIEEKKRKIERLKK